MRNPKWVGGAAPARPDAREQEGGQADADRHPPFCGSAFGRQVPSRIRAHRRPSAPWRIGSSMNFHDSAATPMLAAT